MVPDGTSFSDFSGNWTAMLYSGLEECHLSVAATGQC